MSSKVVFSSVKRGGNPQNRSDHIPVSAITLIGYVNLADSFNLSGLRISISMRVLDSTTYKLDEDHLPGLGICDYE